MAGLPIFGGTFRQWMYGGNVSAPPKQSNADSRGHVLMSNRRSIDTLQDLGSGSHMQHARMKQPGIREHTDESCDLPKSNDILQHLAESCRSRHPQHIGTDDRRSTSCGSTVANQSSVNDSESTRNPYDFIEAEIDQLKEDVSKLREEAIGNNEPPKSQQDLELDRFLATRSRSKIPVLDESKQESAAAKLQRQHEAEVRQGSVPATEQPKTSAPPSPLDFPALSRSRTGSKVPLPRASDEQARKTSYADAATSGMMEAIDHAFSSSGKKRSDSKFSDSTSTGFSAAAPTANSTVSRVQTGSAAATLGSQEPPKEDRSITQPSSPIRQAESPRPILSTPNGKTAKHSPHFAQPTKSFARRAGETLRKDSASVSPKSPAEGFSSKSIQAKEPNLVTAKRASQQQKRKSLPGDWLESAGPPKEPANRQGVVAKAGNRRDGSAGINASARDTGSPVPISKPRGKQDSKAKKVKKKKPQPESPLRQKTSSYMAPTSAATQRNIATLEKQKSKSEQSQTKYEQPQVHASPPYQSDLLPSRPDTAWSDLSSVQFILESNGDLDAVSSQVDSSPRSVAKGRSRGPASEKSLLAVVSERLSTSGSQQKNYMQASQISSAKQNDSKEHRRSDSAASDTLGALPEVANTTTKRRTSHGHLLKPIVACLDAKGLLNKTSAKNGVVATYLQSISPTAFEDALKDPQTRAADAWKRRSEALSGASHTSNRSSEPKKALPPHLRRSREASATSTSTEATLCQDNVNGVRSVSSRASSEQIQPHPSDLNRDAFMPALEPHRKPLVKSSTAPLLRATAREFTPLHTLPSAIPTADAACSSNWISTDKWTMLPLGVRRSIQEYREMIDTQGWRSNNALRQHQSPPSAPFKHVSHHSWAGPVHQTSPANVHTTFIDENGSPHGIEVGQVLKPSLSPGKKTLQWMLQDLDGKETPIRFGRAPPPEAGLGDEPLTPTISSTSDDSPSLKTPSSVNSWHIGSASSPNPYGWAGGDGKEIKFVGYGPYAERDPNSVVNFNFHGRTSSFGTSVPNGFNEDKENFRSREYVAPRSQRQWAQKLGYHKVPCGNVEITHAVEHIPFGPQLAGYCHDCMAN